MTSSGNSHERLCEEILAEARRERDEILLQAQREAGTLSSRAAAEAERLRQEQLDQARAEAARRTELLLATVSVEAHLMRLARIECLLQALYNKAKDQLLERAGFDYPATLLALSREAVRRMAADAFVLRLSPADRSEFGQGLIRTLTQDVERGPLTFTVDEDPAIESGGVIVEDAEAQQAWDNSLGARLHRLWPELRRQIAIQAGWVQSDRASGGGV